jgi:hypothetical protein
MQGLSRLFALATALLLLAVCSRPATPLPGTEPKITPPPTVTIVLPGGTVVSRPARLDSPREAQELVAFPVLVPDQETLPTGLELGSVTWKPRPDQGTEIVTLSYQGPGLDLHIQQLALSGKRMAPPRQPHESIDVRGTTGYLLSREAGASHSLTWEEGGYTISSKSLTHTTIYHPAFAPLEVILKFLVPTQILRRSPLVGL